MGGIPGSSKGCNTCRRRKKGCDLERPTCGTCRRAGRHCEGYERPLKIVSYSSNVTANAKRVRQALTPTENANLVMAMQVDTKRVRELQVHQAFWQNHLPNKSLLSGWALPLSPVNGWFHLCTIVPETRILYLAIGALGYARLHLLDPKNVELRQNGMVLYQQSLAMINSSIAETRKNVTGYEFINACAILGIYEMIQRGASNDNRPAHHGWLSHTRGLISLMRLTSPLAWTDGHAHYQFKSMRLNGIMCATHDGTTTYLNEPAWKTLPWSKHPKNLQDYLVDIMARVPTLMEDLKPLGMPNPDYTDPFILSLAEDLIHTCRDIWQEQRSWYSQLLAFAHTCDPAVSFPSDLLASPLTFPFSLFGLAHITKLYWATSLTVLTIHDQLSTHFLPFLPHLASLSSYPLLLTADPSPAPHVADIITSLPFFYRPELQSVGITNTTFAINVCFRYFQTYSHTLEARVEAMRMNEVLSGLPGSRMVEGFIRALGSMWPHVKAGVDEELRPRIGES